MDNVNCIMVAPAKALFIIHFTLSIHFSLHGTHINRYSKQWPPSLR